MKKTYPIILTPDNSGYLVYVPDFDTNTEGENITEAIEMAEDAIGLLGIDLEDDGKELPTPSDMKRLSVAENDILTYVNVDFTEYRRKDDLRAVKKNCTIPSWLNVEAEKAGINFSAVLQSALKKELGVSDR